MVDYEFEPVFDGQTVKLSYNSAFYNTDSYKRYPKNKNGLSVWEFSVTSAAPTSLVLCRYKFEEGRLLIPVLLNWAAPSPKLCYVLNIIYLDCNLPPYDDIARAYAEKHHATWLLYVLLGKKFPHLEC